jgi:hypothetical protein
MAHNVPTFFLSIVAVVYFNVRVQNEGLTLEIFKEEIVSWRQQLDDDWYFCDDAPYTTMEHDSSRKPHQKGKVIAIGRPSKSKNYSKGVAAAIGSPSPIV